MSFLELRIWRSDYPPRNEPVRCLGSWDPGRCGTPLTSDFSPDKPSLNCRACLMLPHNLPSLFFSLASDLHGDPMLSSLSQHSFHFLSHRMSPSEILACLILSGHVLPPEMRPIHRIQCESWYPPGPSTYWQRKNYTGLRPKFKIWEMTFFSR